MKDITVVNYKKVAGTTVNQGDNSFIVKPIITGADANKLQASFVEVEPGKYAYSYHYHEVNEEVFYIISGRALVKTPKDDIELEAGNAIGFPASPEGAHVISNPSKTEKLVYLDVGSASVPEVAHLLDINSLLVVTATGKTHIVKEE